MNVKPHVTQYPLIHLSAALAAGIATSHFFSLRLLPLTICCTIFAVLSLLLNNRFSVALLIASFVITGGVLGTLASRDSRPNSLRRWLATQNFTNNPTVLLTGVLDRPPEFARDRIYLVLRVNSISANQQVETVHGVVSLFAPVTPHESLQLRFGTRVRVRTQLQIMDQYRNPGVSSLSDYLDVSGFDSTGIIKDTSAIERLDDTPVFPPLAWLYRWRNAMQEKFDSTFSAETAGVLDAALLGNRHNLSESTSERFRASGTFHVLVISGFHITFLGGLVFLVMTRLTRSRLIRFLVSTLVVWSYSLAVGGEASVTRAAMMFTFVTLASVIFRDGTSLNALGAGAIAALVFQPKLLFDPSFQLTFLSVWAIVAIALPLIKTLTNIGAWTPSRAFPCPPNCGSPVKTFCELLFWSERSWKIELARSSHKYRLFKSPAAAVLERWQLQRVLRYLFVTLVVSTIVQLVLLPLFAIYFHRVSPAALILNVVVGFLLAVLSGVALAAICVLAVSSTSALVQLTELINTFMVQLLSHGVASIRLAETPFVVYVLYFASLLYLVQLIRTWNPMKLSQPRSHLCVSAVYLLTLLLVLNPHLLLRSDRKLHVDFLDVGQGDSALITFPSGATLLIDGGGRPSFENARTSRRIGETVVSEYLWWRGLSRVDYLLVTHADVDHIDGLNDVLKNFSVRSVLVGRQPSDDPEFAKLKETIDATRTHLEVIEAGDSLTFDNVVARVLWPQTSVGPSSNNDSVVLRLQFGERTFLFTGDIEKESERLLLESQANLSADVVKVAHHGSRTSSTEEFVRSSSPRFAIISVGRNSMFGHPHKEVVERWQSIGAEVLTTGNCGLISISTDGRDLSIKKFVN